MQKEKEITIARSLYLNHFEGIQKENEELKKENETLRSAVTKLKNLKGCECNHVSHWPDSYQIGHQTHYQTGCKTKGDNVCVVTFSKDSKDGSFRPPETRNNFLCCSKCVDHFYYCGIDGCDPANGIDKDFF